MWSSYEALCEIGATDIDPTSVFGVQPPQIDQLKENVYKANGTLPLQEKSISSPSFNISHHQTPKPLQNLQLGTPSSATPLPQTLFQTSQNLGVTPHQLQFQTPNLTPIPTVQDHSYIANQPASADFMNVPNLSTVRRAKQVAARLYYEPTPETPISERLDRSRYLGGRGALFDTSSISDTPLRRGGRPSELSTARKPRALFLASEMNRSNDGTEVKNIHYGEDQQVISQNDEENDNHAPPHGVTKSTSHPHVEPMKEEEELLDSHKHVEEILKLMCMLGGGYWKLCNVSFACYFDRSFPFKASLFLLHPSVPLSRIITDF